MQFTLTFFEKNANYTYGENSLKL